MAEVSSGRSLSCDLVFHEGRQPRSRLPRHMASTASGAAFASRVEPSRSASVKTFVSSADLTDLNGVTGIDRTLKRRQPIDHFGDVRVMTITSSRAATRGKMFLPFAVAGARRCGNNRFSHADDQIGGRLGEAVRHSERSSPACRTLATPSSLGGGFGGRCGARAGDKERSRRRAICTPRVRALPVADRPTAHPQFDFSKKKNRHQIDPRFVFQFCPQARPHRADDLTSLAARAAGSDVETTVRRGETSTP